MKTRRLIPILLTSLVLGLVCGIQMLCQTREGLPLVQKLEWMTYDWRVRLAAQASRPVATNLGFVFIDDDSVHSLLKGRDFPFRFGPLWPRQVYGLLLRELKAQDAQAVGFDVLFLEARPDHPPYRPGQGRPVGSDDFFAQQLRQCGNAILAAEKSLPPLDLFASNAWAVADISASRDSDGVLRRVEAYHDLYYWHPMIRRAADLLDWDLERAQVRRDRIVFPTPAEASYVLPLDDRGRFDAARLEAELAGESPPAAADWAAAFSLKRAWQIGILLAARALDLDLEQTVVDSERGQIVLKGRDGLQRVIPVDRAHRFLTDWSLIPSHPALTKESIQSLLSQDQQRQQGQTEGLTNRWRGKLVVVGSIATGGNMTDIGTTPLEEETYLIGQHWNVANSVLTGRFIRRSGPGLNLLLVLGLGALSAWLTWRLRAPHSPFCVLLLGGLYVAGAAWAFVRWGWWLPMALPVGGALLVMHVSLVAYKAVHEQSERRRIKHVFSRMVAPAVVNELLRKEHLALGGTLTRVTVAFADLRGFTQFIDDSHVQAEAHIRSHQLTPRAADEYLAAQARELLETVNVYLSLIAATTKTADGTLDKYIGDCVMSFWGAPNPNPRHALSCVQAMIKAQRAIQILNAQRAETNRRLAQENRCRTEAGEAPRLPQRVLELGIGINTGLVTVGLMGSDEQSSYTVFGRVVNLASRLQSQAGPGRIVISQSTLAELRRDAPALAAACLAQPSVLVKGFQQAVAVYEVPWESDFSETSTGQILQIR